MWVISVLLFILAIGSAVYLLLPQGRWRIASTILFLFLVGAAFAGGIEILGHPKPHNLEWRNIAGSLIAGVWIVEDQAIWVMTVREGSAPSCYSFPYDVKDAQELQDQQRRLGQEGGALVVGPRMGNERSEGAFSSILPPPPMPLKQ